MGTELETDMNTFNISTLKQKTHFETFFKWCNSIGKKMLFVWVPDLLTCHRCLWVSSSEHCGSPQPDCSGALSAAGNQDVHMTLTLKARRGSTGELITVEQQILAFYWSLTLVNVIIFLWLWFCGTYFAFWENFTLKDTACPLRGGF